MTSQPTAQCSACTRYRSPLSDENTRGLKVPFCAAFPDAIPDAIYQGMLDHRQSIDGDHGLQWESNGQPFPDWALIEAAPDAPTGMTITQLREIAKQAGLDPGDHDKDGIVALIRGFEARTGQKLIDPQRAARLVAEFVAQLRVDPAADVQALAESIGVPTDVRRAIIRAGTTGRDKAIAAQLRSAQLRTVGEVGAVTTFDPDSMAGADRIKSGDQVTILEPAYVTEETGDSVIIRKAMVRPTK